MHKFVNPARTDDLRILHWAKVKEQDDVYQFAKFNKSIEVFKFSDQEYKDVIAKMPRDAGKAIWSKNDTTILFDLCKSYQLRFIPITDRFNFEKSIEFKK
jgi:DNA methyltransferase 1-associated protein 1